MKMGSKSIISVISFCFIIVLCLPGLRGEADTFDEITSKETVIINEVSGPPDTSSDASVTYLDYRAISSRAKTMQLTALKDAPPFIDNVAFFLTKPHIEIPVSGLEKGKSYSLFIDFVRYRNKNIPFEGMLKIFIRDIHGNSQLVGTADSAVLSSGGLFETLIPFNLSYSGTFTIIIHEYSMKTGNWGIWDIIITSKKTGNLSSLNRKNGLN